MNTIKTVYYCLAGMPLRVNRSKDANRAIATCMLHMQINHYGSRVAQVYDDETGELHAEVRLHHDGRVVMTPKRDLAKYERKYAFGHLLSLK